MVGLGDTSVSSFDAQCFFCCSMIATLLYRRKSRSISPRRRKGRSPSSRRCKSRSLTPRHYKRQRSRSSSLSPTHKSSSPSLGSLEQKNASEKLRKEEEEKKRYISSISQLYLLYYYLLLTFADSLKDHTFFYSGLYHFGLTLGSTCKAMDYI